MIGFISETDALNLMTESHENMIRQMVKVAEDDDNLPAHKTALTRLPALGSCYIKLTYCRDSNII